MTDSQKSGDNVSVVSRRKFVSVTGAAGAAALAGCLGGDDSDGGSGDTTNVAIISSPAGFGDQAFNTLAVQGLESAAEEHNIEIQEVQETSATNYESTQSDLASSESPNYDLIVMVGYQHLSGLEVNAEEYPDQNWMIINDYYDSPNVSGWSWANHQMSFLAGVQAATMTTEDFSHANSSTSSGSAHIGFVGGNDSPLINAFEEAYIAGAEWVNSDVEVNVGYVGGFSDTGVANDIATSHYDNGADIVYHAASAAGEGVFSAAENAGRFAIGVDADQSVTLSDYEDVIMGSAVKYINVGTNEVATAVVEDNWDSVAGNNIVGLEEEAVDLVLGNAMADSLPDVLTTNIEDAKQAILDGDVTVPCSATGC